jgi:hypothetical protein
MRSRLLVPVLALALISAIASCSDTITSLDRNFEDDATWIATMNGANERPTAVTTPATGRAWFIDRGTTIDYRMEYSGLLANANNAHIHRGTADVAGAVMVQLSFVRLTSGVVLGTIDMTQADISSEAGTQTPDELRSLLNSGGAYVNVHSSPQPPGFPAGEIRGQVNRR